LLGYAPPALQKLCPSVECLEVVKNVKGAHSMYWSCLTPVSMPQLCAPTGLRTRVEQSELSAAIKLNGKLIIFCIANSFVLLKLID
jgi:hypothetical protein